jgi:hypothetical protein
MKRLLFGTMLLAFVFTSLGCDSADEAPEDELGSYEITVTGDIQRTLTGTLAQFGAASDPQTGVSGFGLSLRGINSESITVSRKEDRPSNGTHPIVGFSGSAETLDATQFIATLYTATAVYVSESGSLTITTSNDNRLEGTLSFTATNVLPAAPGQVSVSGRFSAVGRDISTP